MTYPRTPIALALSSLIFSEKPVQIIIGISDLMSMSMLASLIPVIFGIVVSVITRSNLPGAARNASSVSKLLVRAVHDNLIVPASA